MKNTILKRLHHWLFRANIAKEKAKSEQDKLDREERIVWEEREWIRQLKVLDYKKTKAAITHLCQEEARLSKQIEQVSSAVEYGTPEAAKLLPSMIKELDQARTERWELNRRCREM